MPGFSPVPNLLLLTVRLLQRKFLAFCILRKIYFVALQHPNLYQLLKFHADGYRSRRPNHHHLHSVMRWTPFEIEKWKYMGGAPITGPGKCETPVSPGCAPSAKRLRAGYVPWAGHGVALNLYAVHHPTRIQT